MARITWITCHKCGEHKSEVSSSSNPYPKICNECLSNEADRLEREWKAVRECLTVEERLCDLETFMYHHGQHYKGPAVFG